MSLLGYQFRDFSPSTALSLISPKQVKLQEPGKLRERERERERERDRDREGERWFYTAVDEVSVTPLHHHPPPLTRVNS